jgi:hypothetical protein
MECGARIILAPLLTVVLTLILAGCKSPATPSFASQPSLDGVWEGQIDKTCVTACPPRFRY